MTKPKYQIPNRAKFYNFYLIGFYHLHFGILKLMANHNELGKIGEEIAAQYLMKSGYKILRRNFFFDKAEIDIIAQKEKDTVVIVEVKTRNSDFFGDPQSFVTPSKIKLLVKAANEYILSNDLDVEIRFDIIAILKNQKTESLEHFENAFYHF